MVTITMLLVCVFGVAVDVVATIFCTRQISKESQKLRKIKTRRTTGFQDYLRLIIFILLFILCITVFVLIGWISIKLLIK